jgi:hypothetical protein
VDEKGKLSDFLAVLKRAGCGGGLDRPSISVEYNIDSDPVYTLQQISAAPIIICDMSGFSHAAAAFSRAVVVTKPHKQFFRDDGTSSLPGLVLVGPAESAVLLAGRIEAMWKMRIACHQCSAR